MVESGSLELGDLSDGFASSADVVPADAAGAMIALLPILPLFVLPQRYFLRGVAEGAVKG